MYMLKTFTVTNGMNTINSLPGDMTTSYASDTKKDTFTHLADVTIPEKPHDMGNLRKVLQLKVGA